MSRAFSECLQKGTKLLKRRLPILEWLPNYSLTKFGRDLLAGVTCGVLIVPHALALASLAGLPPQYGLYTAFPAGLVYVLFGTSKHLSLGPTALISILVAQHNRDGNPALSSLLAFVVGCCVLLIGVFNLGFVTEFISTPALSGFISAIAITITFSQLKYLLGLGKAPRIFYKKFWFIITNLKSTNIWDAVLGISCLVILILLSHIGKLKLKMINCKQKDRKRRFINKILTALGIGRSALIAFVATLISFTVKKFYSNSFTIAGELPPGLPSFKLPFSAITLTNNETLTTGDALKDAGAGIAVLPLMTFLATIAIAKAMAMTNGYQINSSQEAIALGLTNIVCSMFQAYPTAGSFSRTAVNSMTNAATPLTGVVTSLVVVLALTFMTPMFQYVPMSSLAAIITASLLRMIEYRLPIKLWKINKVELIPWGAAFIGSFYEFEIGIFLGCAFSVGIILYRSLKPRYESRVDVDNKVFYFEFKGGTMYPGVSFITNEIRKTVFGKDKIEKIILDCENLFEVDFSTTSELQTLINELKRKMIKVEIVNLNDTDVRDIFMKVGIKKALDAEIDDHVDNGNYVHHHIPLLRYHTEV